MSGAITWQVSLFSNIRYPFIVSAAISATSLLSNPTYAHPLKLPVFTLRATRTRTTFPN
ncbi:unnamed protein product [Haemonchus placei]|uniref:Uncharacterized protein n=1 Tax=Haemonchus placei TaxID=6290 RepID=A0A3P7X3I4_HAEPC|nr:unnamed protein product [Haemonchus placei]